MRILMIIYCSTSYLIALICIPALFLFSTKNHDLWEGLTGSLRYSESSLANLIGCEYETNSLRMLGQKRP